MEQMYKTKNFYLAAFLIVHGLELREIDKTEERMSFVFTGADELFEIAKSFLYQETTIPLQPFIIAIKHLKSAMYERPKT